MRRQVKEEASQGGDKAKEEARQRRKDNSGNGKTLRSLGEAGSERAEVR